MIVEFRLVKIDDEVACELLIDFWVFDLVNLTHVVVVEVSEQAIHLSVRQVVVISEL